MMDIMGPFLGGNIISLDKLGVTIFESSTAICEGFLMKSRSLENCMHYLQSFRLSVT